MERVTVTSANGAAFNCTRYDVVLLPSVTDNVDDSTTDELASVMRRVAAAPTATVREGESPEQ